MNVQKGIKVFDLSRRLSQVKLTQLSGLHVQSQSYPKPTKIPFLFQETSFVKTSPTSSSTSMLLSEHQTDLLLTASMITKSLSQVQPKLEIIDPSRKAPMGRDCNNDIDIIPEPGTLILPKVEPNPNVIIEKKAHRLLKIKKRKMKVHRRKRRWKKYWAMWRKKYAFREKKREVEFRQRLKAKVHEAEKFNAENFVDSYLEDMKYELVPKTWQGKRLPQFLIKELHEEEKRKTERKKMDRTNLLTGQPLVKDGESVQDFINRTWQK